MELLIKQSDKNTWPLAGVLIRGTSPAGWLREIQAMGISLETAQVFPVPGTTPNSVWGCLVAAETISAGTAPGKNEWCQLAHGLLYIPERAVVFPELTKAAIEGLFLHKSHLFHPDFGWVELSETVDWAELLEMPAIQPVSVRTPELPVFVPEKILSFQIAPVNQEEILKSMGQDMAAMQENLEDTPLNALEKAKLAFYKMLFSGKNDTGDQQGVNPGMLGKMRDLHPGMFEKIPGISPEMLKKWQQDFEALEKRNQKKVDRLLDMFKDNPDEALKYAVPLDEGGTGRGPVVGAELDLGPRWLNFDFLGGLIGGGGSSGSGGGGAVIAGDDYFRLQQQYMRTAAELMNKGEYYKAAFIYLKLLKNHALAADALEKGKYYQEAAAIYLQHLNNKQKAAECYEKGHLYKDAIELYKELESFEKAGDLLILINKRKDAHICYEKVAEQYKANSQYVKASLIYKYKIGDARRGQDILLAGWKANADAYNCINNYFANVDDEKELITAINAVYAEHVQERNRILYLTALKYEFSRFPALSGRIREIAHEIIVGEIPVNPSVTSELRFFQPGDPLLVKDILKFRAKGR